MKKNLSVSQYITLRLSYFLFSLFFRNAKKKHEWIVGVDEIASNISQLKRIINGSASVCLRHNAYYSNTYDYSVPKLNWRPFRVILRIVYGPILLGYLANRCDNFYYIWHTGFLLNREVEFEFLKRKKKSIVCHFVGDDIRAPKLYKLKCNEMGMDSFVNYMPENKYYNSEAYDREKKNIANIADKYCDLIFNAPFEQKSYLESQQEAFFISLSDDKFHYLPNKFDNIEAINIVHAPSNPVAKGTPLVRAAIKKLEQEGYRFNYIELTGKSNREVLQTLREAHIVLNQFYSFAPGLLGIESMASYAVLLCSADHRIEPTLPKESSGAWMLTYYWQLYDNLEKLINNEQLMKAYAQSGYDFVRKYHTEKAVKKYINEKLDKVCSKRVE